MNPRNGQEVWTASEAGRWLGVTRVQVLRYVGAGELCVWRRTAFGKRLFRPADVVALGIQQTERRLNGRRRAARPRAQLRLPYWGADWTLTRPATRAPLPWPRPRMAKAGLKAKTEGAVPHLKPAEIRRDRRKGA